MIFPRHPRLLIVVGVIVLASITAVALIGRAHRRPDIDDEAIDKVRAGMTLEQIEATLGKATDIENNTIRVGEKTLTRPKHTWRNSGRTVTVVFEDGHAVSVDAK